MKLVRVTLDEAKRFVREHHRRHAKPPPSWIDDVVTFTEADEDAASVRAAGFTREHTTAARQPHSWAASRGRYLENLLGEREYEPGDRVRWRRTVRRTR